MAASSLNSSFLHYVLSLGLFHLSCPLTELKRFLYFIFFTPDDFKSYYVNDAHGNLELHSVDLKS